MSFEDLPRQTTLLLLQLFRSTEIKAWLYPEKSLRRARQHLMAPSHSLTLLLPCVLKQGVAQSPFVLGWRVITETMSPAPSFRFWWFCLKLQSDITQPSMLHVPLSTCLESKDNILHMSLEMWLEATQATSAALPTTKTFPYAFSRLQIVAAVLLQF